MPTLLLGNKRRQYKQLAVLQQCRLNRTNDPLSAHQRDDHRKALLLVADILKQEWSYLLFERRFLQDTRTFTEVFTKAQVADKLLAALETYEKCLTHQAENPNNVRYDLSEMERRLAVAIQTVHKLNRSVKYEEVGIPKTGWRCTKEYEGWKANRRDMMDPLKGKLRLRERDVPEFGSLMDGDVTVTFCDEFGEEMEEVPLCGTLPTELVASFAQALEHAGDVGWEMQPKPQIAKVKTAAPIVVPQGRSEVAYRPKSALGISTKLEERADSTEPLAPKERTSFRLSLRRKNAALA